MSDLIPYILSTFPGAEIIHTMQELPQLHPKQLARLRGHTTASVRTCKQCGLVGGCQGPVPFSGPERRAQTDSEQTSSHPLCMVIGEAPGPDEDRKKKPFVGRSGKLLRECMNVAGVDPDLCVFLNVVSCFPNDRGKVRAPTMEEKWKCRVNLQQQIAAANTRYMLLVGAESLHSFRDDLHVTRVHGRVFLRQNLHVVMPVIHPASILRRSAESKYLREQLVNDLVLWGEICAGRRDVLEVAYEDARCVICGKYGSHRDSDLVVWCDACVDGREGLDEWNVRKWDSDSHEPARTRPRGSGTNSSKRGRTRGQDTSLFDPSPFNDMG